MTTSLPGQVESRLALLGEVLRQCLVTEIKNPFDLLRRGREIGFRRALDRQSDLGEQPLLICLAPHALRDKVVAQARDRLLRPARADLGAAAVAAGVVGGCMIAEPV